MPLVTIVIALVCLLIAVPADAVDRLVDDGLVPCLSGALPLHGTIGDAVAAASAGETILVCAGTYTENVVVNKADLTLRGQGLTRLVAASSTSPAVLVQADGVTIQNLDVSGANQLGACGVLVEASAVDVRNLQLHDNVTGICVAQGTDHRIRNNVATNNLFAVRIVGAGAEVSGNTVTENAGIGVTVGPCSGTTVTVDHNAFSSDGGVSSRGCPVVITNNTIHGREASGFGIDLSQLSSAVVTRNLVKGAGEHGILVLQSTGVTISFNSVTFSGIRGITVGSSTGVTVTRNNVSRSGTVDCSWDGTGVNVLDNNNCGTQQPAGEFD